MMTVPEAARLTGRNPETIRRWIRSGRLQSQKAGTQHLVEEADLKEIAADYPDTAPSPDAWNRTFWGGPMPDVVAAVRRSRAEH